MDNLDFPLAAEPVLPFIDLDMSRNTGNQVFPWIPHTPLFDSGKPPQRLVQNDGSNTNYGGGRSQSMNSTWSVAYRRGPRKTTTLRPSVT